MRFWTDPVLETLEQPMPLESDAYSVNLSNALFFDLEIRKTVDECGGWEGAKSQGGVSLLCIWDEAEARPHFFDDNDLSEAVERLENAELCVSFNGKWFDMKVLEASWGAPIKLRDHWDVFETVKTALDDHLIPWRGHGLDALCRETLGKGKSGSGEHAPMLLRDGKIAQLTNYCLNDVLLTRDLAKFASLNRFVRGIGGKRIDLPLGRRRA